MTRECHSLVIFLRSSYHSEQGTASYRLGFLAAHGPMDLDHAQYTSYPCSHDENHSALQTQIAWLMCSHCWLYRITELHCANFSDKTPV